MIGAQAGCGADICGVDIVDVIPKNGAGKLLRRVLRDKAKQLRAKQRQAKL